MRKGKNVLHFKILILFLLIFLNKPSYAQTAATPLQVKAIRALVDTARSKMPAERLYLHLDKFNYALGDTIWFKAYVLEGTYFMGSENSAMFYLELSDQDNKLIKRMKLPVRYGLSWGNIALDNESLPTGNYTIRAYTNWMLNFGEAAVYTTTIFVNNPNLPNSTPIKRVETRNNALQTSESKDNPIISINNQADSSRLEVKITGRPNTPNLNNCFLIGEARGVVCYINPISLKNGKNTYFIEKNIFPSGLIRFTLLSTNGKALNEQLIYIDRKDQLKMALNTDRVDHKFRENISLHIKVTDENDVPVQGSFSLSVTDDRQVMTHTSEQVNISTEFLAHGWTGYDWKEVFNPKSPKYKAEPEFVVTGKVSSTITGALKDAKINLFSNTPLMIRDTVADQNGRFIFNHLPVNDTIAYKIQAFTKKGKSLFVNIDVDEWEPPVFTSAKLNTTEVAEDDTVLLQKIKTTAVLKPEADRTSGEMLKQVNINAKKIVMGSHNLNGTGEADQVVTETEMKSYGKEGLFDVLFKRIKSLGTGSYIYPPSSIRKFGITLNGQLVKVIIDGIDVDQSYQYYQMMTPNDDAGEGMQERFQHLKNTLNDFTAEDVKGIEAIFNAKYNTKYNGKYLGQLETTFKKNGILTGVGGSSGIDYAYIEITTRNGKGPFKKNSPGSYLFKPLAFSLPKPFYSPVYRDGEADKSADLRTTLFWVPNITTDKDGNATISFYAADHPTTYTVVIEGSDMNGKIGNLIKRKYLKISP